MVESLTLKVFKKRLDVAVVEIEVFSYNLDLRVSEVFSDLIDSVML